MGRRQFSKPWTVGGPVNQWRKEDGTIDYERLLKSEEGLIKWVMGRRRIYMLSADQADDIYASLRINLCRAAELYNPVISKWSTYATRSLLSTCSQLQEAIRNKKNLIPFSAFEHHNHFRPLDHNAKPLSNEDSDLLVYLMDGLDKRSRKIITDYFINGYTYEEVGERLDPPITRERIRQIILEVLMSMRRDAVDQGCTLKPFRVHLSKRHRNAAAPV